MQRNEAIGLLHKQLCKDSALSRQGIPDYLVVMPGRRNERPYRAHSSTTLATSRCPALSATNAPMVP